MRTLLTKWVGWFKRWGLVVLVSLPNPMSVAPAHAQDLFGFLRALFRPVAPVAAYRPYYRAVPEFERPNVRRPRIVDQPPIKMPLRPKAPGEVTNPLPELLADPTLRPGDMVMFPDGLRVFTGQPGGRHRVTDFTPLSKAAKALPPDTRRSVARLHPGENAAWSADALRTAGTFERPDVRTTGSLRRAAR